MGSVLRKISRVGSLTGGTKWYLSADCLLAAKRMMYVVEYRRFYLRDLESIVVWPSRRWWLRLIIPGILLATIGASLWIWANSNAGEIFVGASIGWSVLELALGPTAESRIRTTGTSVEMRLMKRTRAARKILAVIDAAVRADRGANEPSTDPATSSARPGSEASETASIAAETQQSNAS